MTMPYVSPAQQAEYQQRIQLFAKGATSLECVRSHLIPERTGVCDLTGKKEQEELFVLANRSGATIKVCPQAMQILANIIELTNTDEWYNHLREQHKHLRERLAEETAKREEERKASAKSVVVRKKSPNTIINK